jgi:hypothetical protein
VCIFLSIMKDYKPFLDREELGLILFSALKVLPRNYPLSFTLLGNVFSLYTKCTLFPTICPIKKTNMSKFYGKIVQEAKGHICTKKKDIFGREWWQN